MIKTIKEIYKVRETLTYHSIKKAPAVLNKIIDEEDKIKEIAKKIKKLNPEEIYLAGSGSSFNVAEYGQILFQKFTKIPTFARTSLDYVCYTETRPKILTIVISVSGSKGDATAIAKEAKKNGSFIFAITNVPGSPLEKLSDISYIVPSGKTKSFINTTEYVAQLFALALLIKNFSKTSSDFNSEIYKIPSKIRTSFNSESKIKKLALQEKKRKIFIFSGKGPSKIVADQTALKLRETAWKIKHSESILIDEIPHGRLFSLGDKRTLFVFMFSGKTAKKKVLVRSELIENTGASISGFCSKDYNFKNQFTLPSTNEYLFSILAQPLSYIFVAYMNAVKNLNIDEPRNVRMISKFLKKKY
jgi:glucosamine--fructose-6-phosphate aminotransferase (isomerizing)